MHAALLARRKEAPQPRPVAAATAPALTAPVVSNHAVSKLAGERHLQRVLSNAHGGGMNPAATLAWPQLTALERARIRRLEHDEYNDYRFTDTNEMIAWVVQQENPGALPAAAARVGGAVGPLVTGPAIAPIATTPLYSHRQAESKTHALPLGGPAVAGAGVDPLFNAYTRRGLGKYPAVAPGGPRSNWTHFVRAQSIAALRVLAKAGAVAYGPVLPAVQGHVANAMREATALDAVALHPPAGALDPALASQPIGAPLLATHLVAHPVVFTNEIVARLLGGAPVTTHLAQELVAAPTLGAELDAMWGLVAATRVKPRGNYPAIEVPRWGPVRAQGIGTWVHARFTPAGTWAQGSSSAVATALMPWNDKRLAQRRAPGNVPLYIQGHLLNAHIGGPALAYNLVPLAGAATDQTNQANMAQYYAFEGQAKAAVQAMLAQRKLELAAIKAHAPASPNPWKITGVTYSVAADFGGHPNRQVATANVVLSALVVGLMRDYLAAHAGVATGVMTVQTLHDNLLAGTWAGHNLAYATHWTPARGAIEAVVPVAQRPHVTIDQLVLRMQHNAQLWLYENANVPDRLHAKLEIERAGMNLVTPVPATIDNSIGDSADLPFVYMP